MHKKPARDEDLQAFIKAVQPYVTKAPLQEYPNVGDSETNRVVKHVLNEMWNCSTSIFEFRRPLEDLLLIDYMASRYPWRAKRIKRGKHLEFVWFQFLNLCYVFKEKYRACANRHNRLMELLGRPHRESVAMRLKEIERAIGSFIKARGQHTHEFGVYNERITALSTIELIREFGDITVTLEDEGRNYRVARGLLREDIERVRRFMHGFIERAEQGFVREYSAAVSDFNSVIDRGLSAHDVSARWASKKHK